jgi:hypothetical protein
MGESVFSRTLRNRVRASPTARVGNGLEPDEGLPALKRALVPFCGARSNRDLLWIAAQNQSRLGI